VNFFSLRIFATPRQFFSKKKMEFFKIFSVNSIKKKCKNRHKTGGKKKTLVQISVFIFVAKFRQNENKRGIICGNILVSPPRPPKPKFWEKINLEVFFVTFGL